MAPSTGYMEPIDDVGLRWQNGIVYVAALFYYLKLAPTLKQINHREPDEWIYTLTQLPLKTPRTNNQDGIYLNWSILSQLPHKM